MLLLCSRNKNATCLTKHALPIGFLRRCGGELYASFELVCKCPVKCWQLTDRGFMVTIVTAGTTMLDDRHRQVLRELLKELRESEFN